MNPADQSTSLVFGSPLGEVGVDTSERITSMAPPPDSDGSVGQAEEVYERDREMFRPDSDESGSDDEDVLYTIDGERCRVDTGAEADEAQAATLEDTAGPGAISYTNSGLQRTDDVSSTRCREHRSDRHGRGYRDTWMGPAPGERRDGRESSGDRRAGHRRRSDRPDTGDAIEPSLYLRPGSRPDDRRAPPTTPYSYKSTPRSERRSGERPPGIMASAIRHGESRPKVSITPAEHRYRDSDSCIDPSVATAMNILRQGKIWDPKYFDGDSDWNEYKIHFESCKDLNGWDDIEALKVLLTRLAGSATYVIAQRKVHDWTYHTLIDALDTHYDNKKPEFLVKTKLKRIRQLPGETVQDFAMKLYKLGSGKFETQAQEDYELLDAFTYNVSDKKIMKAIVKQRPRLRTLQEALALAREKEDTTEWLDTERPAFRAHSKTIDPAVAAADVKKLMTEGAPIQGSDLQSIFQFIAEVDKRLKRIDERMADLDIPLVSGDVANAPPDQGGYHNSRRGSYNTSYHSRPQGTGPPTVVTCFYCGFRGHVRRECRKRIRDEGRNQSHNTQMGGSNNPPRAPDTAAPAMLQMHRLQPQDALSPAPAPRK